MSEYKVIECSIMVNGAKLETQLNELAALRWKVIAVIPVSENNDLRIILERPRRGEANMSRRDDERR